MVQMQAGRKRTAQNNAIQHLLPGLMQAGLVPLNLMLLN